MSILVGCDDCGRTTAPAEVHGTGPYTAHDLAASHARAGLGEVVSVTLPLAWTVAWESPVSASPGRALCPRCRRDRERPNLVANVPDHPKGSGSLTHATIDVPDLVRSGELTVIASYMILDCAVD